MSVSQQTQLLQAKEKAEAMEKQIKAYDVLKDDYVKNGASQDEISVYHDLMDHMDLLTDQAKKERDEANQKAKDANEKAKNLNYYQSLVKNIINANLVAGGKVKHRDMMIGEKDNDIQGLESTVKTQESTISTNNEKIANIETNLQKQIKETRYAYRS
jgi:chromosome segregation ATPase